MAVQEIREFIYENYSRRDLTKPGSDYALKIFFSKIFNKIY